MPVEIVGLSKTFPGQRALIDVSMDVRAGEIHALLGQNGSGKSTLIKILAGIYRPDSGGVVRVAGQDLPFGSPRESRRMGLQFVHQSLGIIEELTAVENIAFGIRLRAPRRALHQLACATQEDQTTAQEALGRFRHRPSRVRAQAGRQECCRDRACA